MRHIWIMASMHTEDLALFAVPPLNTAEINKTWVEYIDQLVMFKENFHL